MTIFAWIVIAGSLTATGWYARGLWDLAKLIDESDEFRKYRKD